MAPLSEADSNSLERARDDDRLEQPIDGAQPQLREQLRALQIEVAALREAAAHAREQEAVLQQLREANGNLVQATVNAQTLQDDAEAANRRQNEFLAMLAHELRSPLAPISMAAALLARIPDASPQLHNLTRVIGRQVDHMAHLLNDLLDAARISSGKISLSIKPVSLADVIAQAVETIQPRIGERRQQLHVDIPSGPVATDGDRERLTQVFSNLLGNASKYTGDAGEIRLGATVEGQGVAITVEDTGLGISADVIPHIFELFTQGPRSLARSEGGLGIGLNVVRQLVVMHGGTVEVQSAGIGMGSKFTVWLPLSSAAPVARQPDLQPLAGNPACRVLLIEDNIDACSTLGTFLATEGHDVAVAHDGRAGLTKASLADYDVLICDIGLPGVDGFEVISTIRRMDNGSKPFAIALSGYSQLEDRTRALQAGFDQYFVKPVNPAGLLAMIASDDCQQRRRDSRAS
jgi:signal transduction histidine kinase/ActR/RegA family two-component response regulator